MPVPVKKAIHCSLNLLLMCIIIVYILAAFSHVAHGYPLLPDPLLKLAASIAPSLIHSLSIELFLHWCPSSFPP